MTLAVAARRRLLLKRGHVRACDLVDHEHEQNGAAHPSNSAQCLYCQGMSDLNHAGSFEINKNFFAGHVRSSPHPLRHRVYDVSIAQ